MTKISTRLLVAALLLLALPSAAQPANTLADSLRHQAVRARRAHRYAASSQLYRRLAATSTWRSVQAEAHYNAACAYALAGDALAALTQLRAAARRGWPDANALRTDPDLQILRALPAFQLLVRRMDAARARQLDPDRARLITTDITHFWQAYDRAARDTAHRRQLYQHYYFDRATVGLQDYYASRIGSVLKFVRNLDRKPNFYRAVRRSTEQLAAQTSQIRAGFRALKALYPAAHFPDVYFVIGRYAAAGTVSRNGLLLSADMLAGAPQVPTQELTDWERGSLTPVADLPTVVAHEHIHQLQRPSQDPSLLRAAIEEGMANFLAELTTGRHLQQRQHAYGLAHERTLWHAFQQQMLGSNWDDWLYNSDQETAERPSDLGYFIGYRICEAYYAQQADKQQAVYDLLHITDYQAFLANSHYAEKLAAQAAAP